MAVEAAMVVTVATDRNVCGDTNWCLEQVYVEQWVSVFSLSRAHTHTPFPFPHSCNHTLAHSLTHSPSPSSSPSLPGPPLDGHDLRSVWLSVKTIHIRISSWVQRDGYGSLGDGPSVTPTFLAKQDPYAPGALQYTVK